MPNKHFCQGPNCHTYPTTDRFLKSRGVIRGRYAYATLDQAPNQYGWQASDSDKFFCSQSCKNEWLNKNMECVRARTVVPFITHRRESQGYAKVTEDREGWQGTYKTSRIERVDNRTELD
jgi:hypothetical protein